MTKITPLGPIFSEHDRFETQGDHAVVGAPIISGLVVCSGLGLGAGALSWLLGLHLLMAMAIWIVVGQLLFAGLCFYQYRRGLPRVAMRGHEVAADLSALAEREAS